MPRREAHLVLADGTRFEIIVRYKQLLSGTLEDLPLNDGDLIFVKESFL